MQTEASEIKVSVSGFQQKTYRLALRDGSIEQVKTNMVELAHFQDRNESVARIVVNYRFYS